MTRLERLAPVIGIMLGSAAVAALYALTQMLARTANPFA